MPNEKMTIDELGRRYKANNPGYDAIPDDEMGASVLEMHPQYRNVIEDKRVDVASYGPQAETKKKPNLAYRAAAAIGETLVKPIASLPIQLPQALASGIAGAVGRQDLAQSINVPRQVPILGTVKPLSAVPGTPGASPGEQAAQALNLGASLAPVSKTILGGVGIGAATGGASGVAGALERGAKPSEAVVEGGVGAAIGGTLGAALPVLGALKSKISPSITQGLTQAIMPGKTNRTFQKDLTVAVSELAPEAKSITGLPQLSSALKNAKTRIWSEVASRLKGKEAQGVQVGLKEAADEIRKMAASPSMRLDQAAKDRLLAKASAIESQSFSAVDAEDVIEVINAKAKAYFKKNSIDRASAVRADPDLAADLAIADSLRDGLEAKLTGLSDLKKRYGAIVNVLKAVEDRIPIASQAKEFGLAEQVSVGRTLGSAAADLFTQGPGAAAGRLLDLGGTMAIKELEKADSRVAAAFSKLANQKGMLGALRRDASAVAEAAKPTVKAIERGAIMRAGGILSSLREKR